MNIITEGELGFEMYFIIDGQAQVSVKGTVVQYLTVGNFFGELALLDEMPSKRGGNVVAISDITLAELDVEDFKEVCRSYSSFEEKFKELADKRTRSTAQTTKNMDLTHKNMDLDHKTTELTHKIADLNQFSEELSEELDFEEKKYSFKDYNNTVVVETVVEDKLIQIKQRSFIRKLYKSKVKFYVYFVIWL